MTLTRKAKVVTKKTKIATMRGVNQVYYRCADTATVMSTVPWTEAGF